MAAKQNATEAKRKKVTPIENEAESLHNENPHSKILELGAELKVVAFGRLMNVDAMKIAVMSCANENLLLNNLN